MDIIIRTENDGDGWNEGPEGWDVIPMWDENVFFDPKTTDEIEMIMLVEKAKSGDLKPLYDAVRAYKRKSQPASPKRKPGKRA